MENYSTSQSHLAHLEGVATGHISIYQEWKLWLLPVLLAYGLLASLLRFRRVESMKKRFGYTTRACFTRMTDHDAYLIQQNISELEFPFTFEKAFQFALFRTYGIPSISKLLVATSQLSDVKTALKRYADTEVLLTEFMANEPAHERTQDAMARMNYIHSVYQKAGKISNDDMLYTLSLLAAEPVRWIERYEWRSLQDFEMCALGTFWKSVGDAMKIDYGRLESCDPGWIDGLQWLEEIMAWSEAYEKRAMVPDVNNKKTADETTAILLWTVPAALKEFGRNVVSALMDDRLRMAMIYNKPPPAYFTLVSTIFTVRKLVLRHLSLPRPAMLRVHPISTAPSKYGTYFRTKYAAVPYYVKPTIISRWAPGAWVSRIMGLPVPGDEGEKYKPRGYKIGEVGPESMVGKGKESFEVTKERLRKERTGGCPFGTVDA